MLSSSRSLEVLGTGLASACFLARAARAISARDMGCTGESSVVCCGGAGACAPDSRPGPGTFWAKSSATVGLHNARPHKAAAAKNPSSFRMISPGDLDPDPKLEGGNAGPNGTFDLGCSGG